MSHEIPNVIGANQQGVARKIGQLVPGYMAMGETGMGGMSEMGEMMPGPKNTLPMMAGTGQFGPIEMGGMFTILKVRAGITSYDDPGCTKIPPVRSLRRWPAPGCRRTTRTSTTVSILLHENRRRHSYSLPRRRHSFPMKELCFGGPRLCRMGECLVLAAARSSQLDLSHALRKISPFARLHSRISPSSSVIGKRLPQLLSVPLNRTLSPLCSRAALDFSSLLRFMSKSEVNVSGFIFT